jgi:ribosomal protein S18 acetylase RimI-like enzyme
VARIAVRVATGDDLDTVLALRIALVTEERARDGLEPPTRTAVARARRAYAQQLASAQESTLLACAGRTVIGILRCTESGDASAVAPLRYAFLTSAYVLPEHRQRGALRALLRAADAWCRTRDLAELRLQVQWANDIGNNAWASLGFAPVELRRRRLVPAR